MAISHKPGVNNWNNGRHRNTYAITRDIKQTQPIFSQPNKIEEQPKIEVSKKEESLKIEESPIINSTNKTSENIVEKQLNIEEPKQIKPKKSWDTKNQNSTPPSGLETNI
jgi:hypothetical protein